MLSVSTLNSKMVRKFGRKGVGLQCSVRPIKNSFLVITASERRSLNGDDHLAYRRNCAAAKRTRPRVTWGMTTPLRENGILNMMGSR